MAEISQTVLPGQYITPIYKVDEATSTIHKFLAGKGTTFTNIEVNNQTVPIILATIIGKVLIREVKEKESTDTEEVLKTETSSKNIKNFMVFVTSQSNSYIDFERETIDPNAENSNISINLPKENDVVLVKIIKITARQAYCEILSVEGFGNVLSDSGLGVNGESAHVSVNPGGGAQSLSSPQTIASSQSTPLNSISKDLGESFKGIIRSQDVRSTDRDKVKIIDSFRPGDIVRANIISLGDGSNYYLSTAKNDLGVVFAKSEGGSGDSMYPIDWQHMIDRSTGVIEARKCAKPFTA